MQRKSVYMQYIWLNWDGSMKSKEREIIWLTWLNYSRVRSSNSISFSSMKLNMFNRLWLITRS